MSTALSSEDLTMVEEFPPKFGIQSTSWKKFPPSHPAHVPIVEESPLLLRPACAAMVEEFTPGGSPNKLRRSLSKAIPQPAVVYGGRIYPARPGRWRSMCMEILSYLSNL